MKLPIAPMIGIYARGAKSSLRCDIQMDVSARRGRLENSVIERIHLPKLRQGGIDLVLISTVAHFGSHAYPFFMDTTLAALQLLDCAYMDVADSSDRLATVSNSKRFWKPNTLNLCAPPATCPTIS